MIDSMFQEGTDATLDDQVRRPAAPPPAASSFSLLGLSAAPFRGIGAGVAKSLAFGSEIVGAFGQVAGGTEASAGGMFATQSEQEKRQADAARARLAKDGPDMSNAAGDAFRQRAADIMPDPKTAHTSEQLVAGLFDFGTRAVGYSIALGPLGPVALGGDVALEESDRLKQQGVDQATRTKAGAVAGVLAGASVAVPLTGPTALVRGVKGVAAGEGAIVGQAAAERAILHAAGYDKQAESFDPFDPVALALGLVPGALGARFGHAAPKPLPKLRTEADVRRAAQLTPEEQAHENAYERSATNLAELERAIAAEKRPEVRADLEREMAKQRAASGEAGVEAAVQQEPDLAAAARVGQVAEALDSSRLTPDADLGGRDAHVSAVELAADQITTVKGESVQVADTLPTPEPVSVTFKDNFLSATVEGGQVGGTIRDGALHIHFAELAPERQGAGLGARMYQALVDEAHARGLRVFSDVTVTNEAARVYDALGRRGYDVERLPGGGELPPSSYAPHGAVFGAGAREPAFEVRPRTRTPELTASAADQLRALRQPAESSAPAKPAPEAPAKPEKAPPAQPAEPGQAAIARAAADAAELNPDMLVHLEGMDAPMRVGDLLERVREEAKQDTLAGKLIEVAAACDLTA